MSAQNTPVPKTVYPIQGRNVYGESYFDEAAGLVFLVALRSFDGRLAPALMLAEKPSGWRPRVDGRTTESKKLEAAESAMWSAIARYDAARLSAIAKATGGANHG